MHITGHKCVVGCSLNLMSLSALATEGSLGLVVPTIRMRRPVDQGVPPDVTENLAGIDTGGHSVVRTPLA